MSVALATPRRSRRQSRDPLERLDTPAWATKALIERLAHLSWKPRVVEPCAGMGAMMNPLIDAGFTVTGYDIDPRAGGILRMNTATESWWRWGSEADALITNPPFSLAAHYARLRESFQLVALLTRLTWLERVGDRVDIPDPDGIIVLPRAKFTGPAALRDNGQPYKGSDSVTVCWSMWGPLAPKGIIRLTREDKKRLEAL